MPNYSNLKKSRETIIEMLNDRGYNLPNYLIEITLDEIKASYIKNNINLSTQDGKINTIFWDEPLNISKINNYITKLKNENLNLVLVILGRNNVNDEITAGHRTTDFGLLLVLHDVLLETKITPRDPPFVDAP